jgi:hypothetical protein
LAGYPRKPVRAAFALSTAAARQVFDFLSPTVLQDAEGKKREKAERLRFGRFFYR